LYSWWAVKQQHDATIASVEAMVVPYPSRLAANILAAWRKQVRLFWMFYPILVCFANSSVNDEYVGSYSANTDR
jgi:hypothetical protein